MCIYSPTLVAEIITFLIIPRKVSNSMGEIYEEITSTANASSKEGCNLTLAIVFARLFL
jgi:hypothetical protein